MSATEHGIRSRHVRSGQSLPPEVADVLESRFPAKESPTGLAAALDWFNREFDYDLSMPIDKHIVESAIEIADIRSRTDLAIALRAAIGEAIPNLLGDNNVPHAPGMRMEVVR